MTPTRGSAPFPHDLAEGESQAEALWPEALPQAGWWFGFDCVEGHERTLLAAGEERKRRSLAPRGCMTSLRSWISSRAVRGLSLVIGRSGGIAVISAVPSSASTSCSGSCSQWGSPNESRSCPESQTRRGAQESKLNRSHVTLRSSRPCVRSSYSAPVRSPAGPHQPGAGYSHARGGEPCLS